MTLRHTSDKVAACRIVPNCIKRPIGLQVSSPHYGPFGAAVLFTLWVFFCRLSLVLLLFVLLLLFLFLLALVTVGVLSSLLGVPNAEE